MKKLAQSPRRLLAVACLCAGAVLLAPATAKAAVSCGDTITSSVTLTSDLVCPGGTALFVLGDGVTVNLEGHSIVGGTVFIGGNNVALVNGTVPGIIGGGTFVRIRTGSISSFQIPVSLVSSIVVGGGVNVTDAALSISNSRIMGGTVSALNNGATITGSLLEGVTVQVLNQGLWLVGNMLTRTSITVFSTFPDTAAVGGNRFLNSTIDVRGGAVRVDLGANRGNGCNAQLVCAPL